MKKRDIFIKGIKRFFTSFTGLVYIIIVISLWISVYSSFLKLNKSTSIIKKEQEKVKELMNDLKDAMNIKEIKKAKILAMSKNIKLTSLRKKFCKKCSNGILLLERQNIKFNFFGYYNFYIA